MYLYYNRYIHIVLGNISKFNGIMILKHYRVWSYAPQYIAKYKDVILKFLTNCTMCTFQISIQSQQSLVKNISLDDVAYLNTSISIRKGDVCKQIKLFVF